MKLRKIIAAVAASALALSVMAFPASAADPLMIKFSVQDAEVGWATVVTEAELNGDGDYSITATVDQPYSAWGKIAIEAVDPAAANIPDYASAVMNIKSIVVNGDTEMPLADVASAFPLSHADAGGKIDTNIINVWYDQQGGSPIDISEGKAKIAKSTSITFLDESGAAIPISSWTINFTLSGVGGAPAGDASTTSAATGNTPVALIGGVAMLALVGAVVSRKRK